MSVRTMTKRCSCGLIVTCDATAFQCPHCDKPCLETAKGCTHCKAINVKSDPA